MKSRLNEDGVKKQAKWMAVGGACVLLAAAAHARCGPGMAIQLRPKKEWKEQVVRSYHPERRDHFLFAKGAGAREIPREEWKPWWEKIKGWDAVLGKVDPRGGREEEWRRMYLEAAAWRYPRDGDLLTAVAYFKHRAEWTRRAFHNGTWRSDPETVLTAAVGVLTEMAEWSFPREWVMDGEGDGRKGVRPARASPGTPEALARKAENAAKRRKTLDILDIVLRGSRRSLANETWERCEFMLSKAQLNRDAAAIARLVPLRKRILGSLDDYEREQLLRGNPPLDLTPPLNLKHHPMKVLLRPSRWAASHADGTSP